MIDLEKYYQYDFKVRFGIHELQNRATKSSYARWRPLQVTDPKVFIEIPLSNCYLAFSFTLSY